jgi:hypothetical protein
MRIRVFILFIILFLRQDSFCQKNIGPELTKVSQAYLKAIDFSADVKVVSYKTKNDINGQPMGKGVIRKSKQGYYSKYLDDELMTNEKCMLIIDNGKKEITYFDGSGYNFKGMSQPTLPPIDSLLKRNDSVVFKENENGENHFIFFNKQGATIRTDVYVNRQTHFVSKIVYYYAASDKKSNYDMYKVEITYLNIKIDKIDNSFFSESKYVSYKKGKPVVQAAYDKYKLNITKKYKSPQ